MSPSKSSAPRRRTNWWWTAWGPRTHPNWSNTAPRHLSVYTLFHHLHAAITITGLSTELLTDYHRTTTRLSVRWFVWKVGEGFPDRTLPSLLKLMGRCVFQCDVPHLWIAKQPVGPVSVYCDGLGCHVLCLRHGIPVCQHIGQSISATVTV